MPIRDNQVTDFMPETDHITTEIVHQSTRNARRHYDQHYGSVLVMNHYLKLMVLLLVAAVVWHGFVTQRFADKLAEWRPSVIEVDRVTGEAKYIDLTKSNWTPSEAMMKRDLAWFTVSHFARRRVKGPSGRPLLFDDYARSFLMLDKAYASGMKQHDRETDWEVKFAKGEGDQVEIDLQHGGVTAWDLRRERKTAEVSFQKVFFNSSYTEDCRESWKAVYEFDYGQKESVDVAVYNPLGMRITYMKVSQQFGSTCPDSVRPPE